MTMSEPSGQERSHPWISSAGDSHARTSRARERAKDFVAIALDCGLISSASSTSSGPNGSWSRTSGALRIVRLTRSPGGWTGSAMRRLRSRFRRRNAERLISEGVCFSSLIPTPTASDGKSGVGGEREGGPNLRTAAARGLLPTPVVNDAKAGGSRSLDESNANPGVSLTDVVVHGASLRDTKPRNPEGRGHLSPRFVEWMMGLPLDWTAPDSPPWGTQLSLFVPRSSAT